MNVKADDYLPEGEYKVSQINRTLLFQSMVGFITNLATILSSQRVAEIPEGATYEGGDSTYNPKKSKHSYVERNEDTGQQKHLKYYTTKVIDSEFTPPKNGLAIEPLMKDVPNSWREQIGYHIQGGKKIRLFHRNRS